VKPIRKAPSSKAKIADKPAPTKKPQGETPGPDERRPDVKADEIYGDTKIPEHKRKK
jgi:hypothetical protein